MQGSDGEEDAPVEKNGADEVLQTQEGHTECYSDAEKPDEALEKNDKHKKTKQAPKSRTKAARASKSAAKNAGGGFNLSLPNLAASHNQNALKVARGKAGAPDDDDEDLDLIEDSSRSQTFHDELSQISKMHSQKLMQKLARQENGQMDELQAKYKQLIDQLQTDLSSQIIQKYSQIIEANHQEYFKQLNK